MLPRGLRAPRLMGKIVGSSLHRRALSPSRYPANWPDNRRITRSSHSGASRTAHTKKRHAAIGVVENICAHTHRIERKEPKRKRNEYLSENRVNTFRRFWSCPHAKKTKSIHSKSGTVFTRNPSGNSPRNPSGIQSESVGNSRG